MFLGGSREHVGPHACVEGGGRESPGVRITFFCFAKRKSPKKRRPPVCDPFAVRRGRPAAGRLRGAPWNSLCAGARRSDIHGESEHEARALRRAATPQPPRRRHSQQGVDIRTAEQPDIHSGHCCARPRLRSAWRLRPRDGAERSAAKQWPVWMSVFGFPTARAEKRRAGGACVCRRTHALRALTCRSCLNGARSAQ